MATRPHRQFMTCEEFEAMPREGMLTMLLDGEYIRLPSPRPRHQELVGRLYIDLAVFVRANALGRVFTAPLGVVLSKARARVVQPDVFFLPVGADQSADELITGAPALAVEVLSRDANRYDKGKKLEYYDEYGTAELWHVWKDRPRIEVYRRDAAGRLRKSLDLGPGDRLITPLLPGLAIDVDELYRDLP